VEGLTYLDATHNTASAIRRRFTVDSLGNCFLSRAAALPTHAACFSPAKASL
jgi:hypothetical protein